MTGSTFDERLSQLPSVSLMELDTRARLLTRRDRKYLVPAAAVERLLVELGDEVRVLEIDGRRQFRYESIYFDTPDHASYLKAARRRRDRFKVRTRTYLDTGICVLEVKTRDGRGRTVKTQHDKSMERRDRLDHVDRELVGAYREIGAACIDLELAVTTRYARATLLLGAADNRATIDNDVRAVAPDGRTAYLPGMSIIESKSTGAPSNVDRVLWSMGYRPLRVSKFGTGLAALFPELPSNKWHRALGAPWEIASAA